MCSASGLDTIYSMENSLQCANIDQQIASDIHNYPNNFAVQARKLDANYS